MSDHIATFRQQLDDADETEECAERSERLGAVHRETAEFLGSGYDLDAIDAMLAAAAGDRIGGDPAWLLIVGGSGNAKTETVASLIATTGALITSTIQSPGAMLSGSSKSEREQSANGGLLRRIGSSGTLVIKDFTSILSMDRNVRGQVLAALREVYDGYWERNVGTGGGKVLTWHGRIVVIGAVTTAWDAAHGVIAQMGDRFVLLRLDSDDDKSRREAGRQSVRMTGQETDHRKTIAAAVAAVLDGKLAEPTELTDEDLDRLLMAADLVTRLRTAVETDYRGDAVDAHALEMPTRFGKQLAQIVRGATAVGMDFERGMSLALRCAGDSIPPLRLIVLDDVRRHPGSSVGEVADRTGKPRTSARRTLDQLQLLGALRRSRDDEHLPGDLNVRWSVRAGLDVDTLRLMVDRRSEPPGDAPEPVRECE